MGVALSKYWGWWRHSVNERSNPETCSSSSSNSSSSFLSCYEWEEFNVEAAETIGSSSSYISTKYDVFLSFSGKDTRDTFTSHLYHELIQHGIQTFLDEEELKKGKQIAQNLDEAVTESRIFIPIFSKHYASSKWCLNELVKFKESSTIGQTVLPIFYHVNPRDVRKQSGDFGQQFQLLAEKSDRGTVERWKEALRKTGESKGWHIDHGNESQLIQGVVKHVWCELSRNSFDVSVDLVGIDSCMTWLLYLLNLECKDVKIVGIWGMGGIGKTTLAEAIFKQIQHKFEGHIFLEDIREVSKQPKGLVSLQKQLLSATLKRKIQLKSNVNEGKSFFKKCLHAKKVLILLDDVDNNKQLEALAGRPDWFGPGSRIIITTRDEHVLNVHKVHEIYEAKELDFDQSLHLFSKHAFGKDQPTRDFLKLAKDVVAIAGGLPLALKVLGSFLFDKRSPKVWRSTLDKLKKIPEKDIEERLKISYDGLDDLDKQIFLDIACFFNGTDEELATYIEEGCGFSAELGIENLIQKSLITIKKSNELRMHDQLRDMGRHIVYKENRNKPGMRSRLWSHEEIMDVLKRKAGTENVEGIVLEGEETALKKIHVSTDAFEMMSELRLLQIDNADLEGDFEKLPSKLRWLSWKGCPLESIPTNFCLEKVVVLDLSDSRIKQVWNDLDQNKDFRELKVLVLSKCGDLNETPIFSRLPNLEILNLEGCIKLEELQSSICRLTSLKKLILSGCLNIRKLPDLHGSLDELEVIELDNCKLLCRSPDSISKMINLKSLSLDGTSITELPDAVGLLEKIEILSVDYCSNLVKLPDSMGKMRLLRKFYIAETGIVKLPEDFGMLSSLEVLHIQGCQQFKCFPENFGNLVQLTDLFASRCSLSEGGIPSDLGKLSSLQWLDLSCNSFCSLPTSISNLSQLGHLRLNNCRNLQFLPQMPSSLQELEVENCVSLESLSDMSDVHLYNINLSNCKNLADIQGFKLMEYVSELYMSGCSRAAVNNVCKALDQSFPEFSAFPGSKIPDCFTPMKLGKPRDVANRYQILLDYEVEPTRLWNLQQQQKIIGVVFCFVLTNQPEISSIEFSVVIKGELIPLVTIPQNRHQHQIYLCRLSGDMYDSVSELEEGDRILLAIESEREVEVPKVGMHLVYEGIEQSIVKRFADFISRSSHNDVVDGCEPNSRERTKFQLLHHHHDDDDEEQQQQEEEEEQQQEEEEQQQEENSILASSYFEGED